MRLTPTLVRVLNAFLEEPGTPRYGYDLMQAAKIQSGTLYPLLSRLEELGWVETGWQQAGTTGGRPPRKYYKLTNEGLPDARRERAAYVEHARNAGTSTRVPPKLAPGRVG